MQVKPQVEEGALSQPEELNTQVGGPSTSNQVKPEAGGKFYPEARRTSISSHWLGTGTRAPHRTPSPEVWMATIPVEVSRRTWLINTRCSSRYKELVYPEGFTR